MLALLLLVESLDLLVVILEVPEDVGLSEAAHISKGC